MNLSISKKFIVITLIIIFVMSAIFALPSAFASTPNTSYTIVIDAGHGGVDGGAVGRKTGKDENSLNLEYAKELQKIFEEFNFKVVMTRSDLNGLYSTFSVNKKKDDMAKRKEIINNSGADLVVSIHMNSHHLTSYNGAQVFYKENHLVGQKLAENIQETFVQTLPNARTSALKGDYYILNCTNLPAVIVECGYLSNPNDEQLLLTTKYKELVCQSIFVGILKFLSI